MTIRLLTTKSENNRIDKSYRVDNEISGDIKDQCSILSPTIILQLDSYPVSNYAYIVELNRYYFIQDIVILCDGVYQLSLRVDVLMSYKSQIKSLDVIVNKQEKRYNSNKYINDGSFVVENRTFNQIINFQNGFSNNAQYVLVTAGA